ncbi:MAG: hypothetical protein R3B09_06650 [Nannocystaceae bacterium]
MHRRGRPDRIVRVVAAASLSAVVGCLAPASELPSTCPIEQVERGAAAAERCRIAGDGSRDWTHPVSIYRSPYDAAPIVILHHPDSVAVTWSELR